MVMDRREYYKQWREKNKEHVKEKREETKEIRKVWRKQYDEKNREKINEQQREWRKKNPERVKEIDKERYKRNPQKRRESSRKTYKKRRQSDPVFRASENVRRLILLSFKGKGYTKKSKTYQILGCTFEEFKQHLEKQFEPWMNWDNYGKYNGELNFGWDIDHVIPRSTIKTEEDVSRLNHHTNLRPLCSKINRDIKKNNPDF